MKRETLQMSKRRIFCFFILLVLLSAGFAQAFLPPDASAREPQIRAYRQRVREEYEQRIEERRAELVQAHLQTRAEVFTPPWMRDGASAGMLPDRASSLKKHTETAEEKKMNRFMVSILLLSVVAAVTGWVRYITRETGDSI